MKKVLILICIAFVHQLAAQTPVHFHAVYSRQKELSQDINEALKLKVEQILGRTNAGGASKENAFVIEPSLTILAEKSTQGLVRNVSATEAELTLTAKNQYDGSVYNTMTTKVKAAATGNQTSSMREVIKNINVTNPAFTRFVRTTRERITEHYTANCADVLSRAHLMVAEGAERQAIAYLMSVPKESGCYAEILPLLNSLLPPGQQLPDEPENEESEVVFPEPIIEEDSTIPVPPEKAEKLSYKLNVSCPDLEVVLLSCIGNEITQTITLQVQLINKKEHTQAYMRLEGAIDNEGVSYGRASGHTINMPVDVKMTQTFTVAKITKKIPVLSYVELSIRNCQVALRDIPVTWK
ncbi:MAG: hypothetical protein LUG98_01350 [Tannerellaceae bacterium]|nr:hypothetical protein [Tannerellaceae bacterium]